MEFDEFADQIFAVNDALVREFSERPFPESLRLPQDWPTLQAAVRGVAENLILCSGADEAIVRLRQDQAGALATVWLIAHAPDDYHNRAAQRAHAATLHEPTTLPFHAYCAYLIEICDLLKDRLP